MILANEGLLKQIWTNLLDNGIKFSSEKGVIKVEIEQKLHMQFPILQRCHPRLLFKLSTQISGMGIACFKRYFRNGFFCVQQQGLYMADTDLCQVLGVGLSKLCVEQPGKMRGRVAAGERRRLKGRIFMIMLFHIINGIYDRRCERCLVHHLYRIIIGIIWKPALQYGKQKVTEHGLEPEAAVGGIGLVQCQQLFKVLQNPASRLRRKAVQEPGV